MITDGFNSEAPIDVQIRKEHKNDNCVSCKILYSHYVKVFIVRNKSFILFQATDDNLPGGACSWVANIQNC